VKVLVTGHDGYIGRVLVAFLRDAGHEVAGLDAGFFDGCDFGPAPEAVPARRLDVRDADAGALVGFDAVVHLAALSNDPLGDLNPDVTYAINGRASVRLAALAREAGVPRFLFSSSCSLYGAGSEEAELDETAAFHPVTAYGHSKILAEQGISALADDRMSPTYLRNATVYGVSSRLRADLVVNNLVGYAVTTGEVLLKSDGSPWRPLIHVEDVARAFLAVLEADRDRVHDEAFNVGRPGENYRIRQVAEAVAAEVAGSRVGFAEGASPDLRNYRVDFGKLATRLPAFRPRWTVREGVRELAGAYRRHGLDAEGFLGPRYLRIRRIRELQAAGRVDDALRWRPEAARAAQGGAAG
jgi:nucleoside-diphosphate-sugar epimerase